MKNRVKKIILLLTVSMLVIWLSFILFVKKTNNVQTEIINPPPVQEETKISEGDDQIKEIESSEARPVQNIPEKYLLDMPFYSQAPLSKWDAFHEDMCEEASVLNAAYYLIGKKPSKEEYEKELQKMQNAEQKEIGEWKSATVTETKKLVDVYFGGAIKSRIIENPTIENIESEIAAGRPVVVPLSGRDIGNPNFKAPGPIYHMLAVKGYDAQNFITNDVGTRKGNSYVYKKDVIMKNIHDWNAKDIHLGASRILVLYK